MKSYAKTLPGSVYSVDRRTDETASDEVHDARGSAAGATEEK
jgi:hypothetical protein